MRSTQDLVGFAALMAAVPAVVGQAVTASSSLQSNFSLTSVRPSASPRPTNFCCYMVAEAVGLNFWWNTTRGPYTATVVTSYIEYDNTVVTEVATITNPWNGSYIGALGVIPNDIIPTGNEYRATTLANFSSIASYQTTAVASPTPHLVLDQFDLFTGTYTTNTEGSSSCKITYTGLPVYLSTVARFLLPTKYVYVEDPVITRTDSAFLPPPPTDIIDSLTSQNPTIMETYPYFTGCPISSGTGQPTVHIPVTALTSSSSTTVRRPGNAPGATTSSGDQTTQEPESPSSTTGPAPGPTTTPADPPSTSNQPEVPSATTQPTSASSLPSNTAANPPSPPANSQAPPQDTQAPPASTQANPDNTPTPPVNSNAPPNPVPTTAGDVSPSDAINPPAPGNTQSPVESGQSPSQPSNIVSPPADAGGPSNIPSLPFPIAPVPVPIAVPSDNNIPSTGGSPTSAPNPGAVVLPGDQTLNPGQQTTISGVVISVPSPAVPDSSATLPVVIIDGTTSIIAAAPTAPPLVVVDGTTVTLPAAEPTEVGSADVPSQLEQPAVPVTLGTQVLTLEVPSASGEGIVLPNSETLELGSTTVIDDQTLVATVVTSGTGVATVVEVADESTTTIVTLPTVVPTETDKTSGATGTSSGLSDFTGGAVSGTNVAWGWGLVNAFGLAVLGIA